MSVVKIQDNEVREERVVHIAQNRNVGLVEATEAVQSLFRGICCGFLSFSVIAALDDKRLPYIAMRIKEHCLLEDNFRVHDVVVNRDGTIHATRLMGIDGKDQIPAFTGR